MKERSPAAPAGRTQHMRASAIFQPKPERWGLRGDPYFWDYLERLLSHTELSSDPDWIERIVRNEHYRLTGKTLTRSSIGYVEAFAHGGMSSGGISGKFWTEEGIPLLRSRCVQASEEDTDN